MDKRELIEFYTTFEGRLSRRDFAMRVVLPALGISIVASVLDMAFGFKDWGPFAILVMLALIWPCIATSARRLHDVGQTGWWQLVFAIPLIGLIAFIVLMCMKGTEGPNKYGPEPVKA